MELTCPKSCVQVTITGSTGQAQNPPTVSIPGYVDINSPGLLYNIWLGNDYSSYPKLDKIFGGKLFTDSTSQSPAVPSPVVSSPAVVTPPVDVPKVPTTFVTRVATSSKSEATKVPNAPDTPKQDEDKEPEEVPDQAECKKWCKIKLVLKQLTELYALPEDE
jgi:hypothetical protein